MKYDPMLDVPNPVTRQPSIPMAVWYDEIMEVRKTWEQMFGNLYEEVEHGEMMHWTVTNNVVDALHWTTGDFSDDSIREEILHQIAKDDWAYEIAYGVERVYPEDMEFFQIGIKETERKIRRSKNKPCQIVWAF